MASAGRPFTERLPVDLMAREVQRGVRGALHPADDDVRLDGHRATVEAGSELTSSSRTAW
jgi:hypothetical protein